LFQENGPCHFVNGDTTPSLNPYSFNEFANMLYIDQPIGVGFSYGTDPVTSTVTAAPYVWTLLQAFFAQFPQYESRDFGIFTESYGGHYGPEFASYFESQNAAIAKGTVTGQNVSLIALGINNGWYDPIIRKCFIFSALALYRKHNTNSLIEYKAYVSTTGIPFTPILDCFGGHLSRMSNPEARRMPHGFWIIDLDS
jgi:carboxypeptidase C (cathepsin A)